MVTAEQIRRIAPKARADYVTALVNGQEILDKYGINTPMRVAQFLATCLHESGGLTIVRENMNYTAKRIGEVWPSRPEAKKFAGNPIGLANCVYNGRMGNRPGTDDGWRFRGAGLIQTTGREHFETIGREIGLPLGEEPELIEKADVALIAAAWEFSKWVKYCDRGASGFRAVSNAINRGNPAASADPIGWPDRQLCLRKCTDCFCSTEDLTPDDTLDIGDHGALVSAFQARLTQLGYLVGKIDGVYGSRMRAAVLAFQAENGLATDGTIGPKTRAALNSEAAKPMPASERASEGKAELKAAGSETIAATSALKSAAQAVGATTTGFAVADQTGVLDVASNFMKDMSQFQGVASQIALFLTWVLSHWYYLIPLLAYLVYRWADKIEVRRVLAHQLGWDLTR